MTTSDVHCIQKHGSTTATHGLASCATGPSPYGAGGTIAPLHAPATGSAPAMPPSHAHLSLRGLILNLHGSQEPKGSQIPKGNLTDVRDFLMTQEESMLSPKQLMKNCQKH